MKPHKFIKLEAVHSHIPNDFIFFGRRNFQTLVRICSETTCLHIENDTWREFEFLYKPVKFRKKMLISVMCYFLLNTTAHPGACILCVENYTKSYETRA
jgi:hypothetical protein